MSQNRTHPSVACVAAPRRGALPHQRMGLLLVLALGLLATAEILAGLSLRGLFADGTFYAAELWQNQGYFIEEPARITAQILTQSPAVLMLHLGLGTPARVALLLSLSNNLMPLALLLGAAALLPVEARAWALVPMFVYLAFGMASATASIGDGNTAAAYAWGLFLLLLWGSAGRGARLLILGLACGALRLYEAMAFLGPVLALAASWRLRAERQQAGHAGVWTRGVLIATLVLLAAASAISLHDLIFPRLPGNRSALLSAVISCRWLWAEGGPHATAWLGLLGVLALPVVWLEGRAQRVGIAIVVAAFVLGTALALWLQPVAAASFAARANFCLASGPVMLALLLARQWRLPASEPRRLMPLISLMALSLALADLRATEGWLRYTADLRGIISTERGVIPWAKAIGRLPDSAARRNFEDFSWPWTAPLMSLWLAPPSGVTSVIANPPGSSWEPFPPARLAPLLLYPAALPRPSLGDALLYALG